MSETGTRAKQFARVDDALKFVCLLLIDVTGDFI